MECQNILMSNEHELLNLFYCTDWERVGGSFKEDNVLHGMGKDYDNLSNPSPVKTVMVTH